MSSISPVAQESWVRRYKRNGRAYGCYFGFYRFPGEPTSAQRRVNLETKDKRAAEQRLRRIVDDDHAVREGLRPAPDRVAASRRPLSEQLVDFEAQLAARELSAEYRRKIRERMPILSESCGWSVAGDMTRASFEAWRVDADLAAKTKNDYLDMARAFAGWLVDLKVLGENPLAGVKKARGRQRRPRRALTLEEAKALLVATPCPRRRMLYLLATSSGGRVGELLKLRWEDIDSSTCIVTFRGETSKNGRTQGVLVPRETIEELASYRAGGGDATDRVFPRGIGRHTFDDDLKRAGIAKKDGVGRAATLHGLRNTFNQLLQESGVSLRHAQHQMRHSDPRLTANTYLDPERLTIDESMALFPSLVGDSARSTAGVVAACHSVSPSDARTTHAEPAQLPVEKASCRRSTSYDAERRQPAKKWSRGDSNPRAETVSKPRLRV